MTSQKIEDALVWAVQAIIGLGAVLILAFAVYGAGVFIGAF